jgi:hypothetical protein
MGNKQASCTRATWPRSIDAVTAVTAPISEAKSPSSKLAVDTVSQTSKVVRKVQISPPRHIGVLTTQPSARAETLSIYRAKQIAKLKEVKKTISQSKRRWHCDVVYDRLEIDVHTPILERKVISPTGISTHLSPAGLSPANTPKSPSTPDAHGAAHDIHTRYVGKIIIRYIDTAESDKQWAVDIKSFAQSWCDNTTLFSNTRMQDDIVKFVLSIAQTNKW